MPPSELNHKPKLHVDVPVDVRVAALRCVGLQERRSTANVKESLRDWATQLSVDSWHQQAQSMTLSSATTKLPNQTHKQILFEEQYVASLESMQVSEGRVQAVDNVISLVLLPPHQDCAKLCLMH